MSTEHIDEAVSAYGLSFEAVPADANPAMPQDSDGMAHWDCTLTPEGGDPLTFTVSLGGDHAAPTASDALALVLADVGAYRGCDGFESFARAIGIEDGGGEGTPAEAAWDELSRIDGALVAMLGDEAVASLSSGSRAPERALESSPAAP